MICAAYVVVPCKVYSAISLSIDLYSFKYYAAVPLALQAVAVSQSAKALALEAARHCLARRREVAKKHSGNKYLWAVCCHWLALQYPIMTPFTLLFRNAISSEDDPTVSQDLELL